jgi:hypothetical protein
MLLTACSGHDGRLLVVVSTDMPVPSGLAHIEVRTVRSAGGGMDTRGFPVDDADPDVRRHMPLSFAVEPNGHPADGVEIIVEGYGPGDPICTGLDEPSGCRPMVSRTVRTGFSANTTRVVDIFLADACRAVSCPGQNCVLGRCAPIMFTPPDEWPILELPGAEFDTRRPDAGMDAPPHDTRELDVPGLDVPGLDVPGLDAPFDGGDLDVPAMDTPGPDAPGFTPGLLAEVHALVPVVEGRFGTSVALNFDGTIGLVGEPFTVDGRAHVLEGTTVRSGAPLEPPIGTNQFGWSVALGGTGGACRALVGAIGGMASAIPYDCVTWTRGAAVMGSGLPSTFGVSTSINEDGTRAVVGDTETGAMNGGHVFVFEWATTVWSPIRDISLVGERPGDILGTSVAIDSSGARVLAGAPGLGASDAGGVLWVDTAGPISLIPVLGAPVAQLGISVALSGDGTLALLGQVGEVLPYRFSGGTWTAESTPLSAETSTEAPTVVLDAAGDDALVATTGLGVVGAVRWYHRTGTTWTHVDTFRGTTAGDNFGASVAISRDGRRALVGSPGDSTMGSNTGAVYVYALAP